MSWYYVWILVILVMGYALLQSSRRAPKRLRSQLILTTILLGLLLAIGNNYAFLIVGVLMVVLDIIETKPKTKYVTPKVKEAL